MIPMGSWEGDMATLKQMIKIANEVSNGVQALMTLLDSIKALRERLPELPPDFWHWVLSHAHNLLA